MSYAFCLVSPLEKVFWDEPPRPLAQGAVLSAWRGTRASVQLACRGGDPARFDVRVLGAPCAPRVRAVGCVPSDFPCYERRDGDYLRDTPGLFPDPLMPMERPQILALPGQYRSVLLTFDVPQDARTGDHAVEVEIRPAQGGGDDVRVLRFTLRVRAAELDAQTLWHTEWFHADCLAQYYGVEPYSEAHWAVLEQFIEAAVREHGVNALLTPVFTPPLDTAVGGERLCVQLVEIFREGSAYRFDFARLDRWAAICRRHGVKALEIAHLFTQWGAEATPNVYVWEGRRRVRAFGWDVPATSPEYRRLLCALLPALRARLASLGYDDAHVICHISDEPSRGHEPSYRAARAQAVDLLAGCRVVDALSDLTFYQQGLVEHPVVAVDHIEPFVQAGVPGLWAYYCCAQCVDVPNRFLAMPLSRCRVLGVLLYLYRIEGFLHWGYNFYNTQYSLRPVDPFFETHANYAFPSGDAYLVYPGPNGEPLSSLRAEAQADALVDLRALRQLERLAGRAFTVRLVLETAGMREMTFARYPRGADFLLRLRERVADEIDARLS